MFPTVSDVANVTTVVAAIAAAVTALLRWRRRRAREITASDYSTGDMDRASRWYVPPDVLSEDPANLDEPFDAPREARRESLFHCLDRLLAPESDTKYILLLGDSGMGKTSALLNYHARYARRFAAPYIAVLKSLATQNVIEAIRSQPNKPATLLMLDGVDEFRDPNIATSNLFDLLTRETASYAKVILTCRTQYFSDDSAIPLRTAVARLGPRAAGEEPSEGIVLLYLAPLSTDQIEIFLSARFPWLQIDKRRRAHALLNTVPRLAVRPMLLSFLDDVAGDASKLSLSSLYEAGIDAWVERESHNLSEAAALRLFSTSVAIYMWDVQQWRIPWSAAASLANTAGIELEERRLSGRSLLNRDAQGRWKFAHLSIMEFLIAQHLLDSGPLVSTPTAQMLEFIADRLHGLDSTRIAELCQTYGEPFRQIALRLLRDKFRDDIVSQDLLRAFAHVLLDSIEEPRVILFRSASSSSWVDRGTGGATVLASVGPSFDLHHVGVIRIVRTTSAVPGSDQYLSIPLDFTDGSVLTVALRYPSTSSTSSAAAVLLGQVPSGEQVRPA